MLCDGNDHEAALSLTTVQDENQAPGVREIRSEGRSVRATEWREDLPETDCAIHPGRLRRNLAAGRLSEFPSQSACPALALRSAGIAWLDPAFRSHTGDVRSTSVAAVRVP